MRHSWWGSKFLVKSGTGRRYPRAVTSDGCRAGSEGRPGAGAHPACTRGSAVVGAGLGFSPPGRLGLTARLAHWNVGGHQKGERQPCPGVLPPAPEVVTSALRGHERPQPGGRLRCLSRERRGLEKGNGLGFSPGKCLGASSFLR